MIYFNKIEENKEYYIYDYDTDCIFKCCLTNICNVNTRLYVLDLLDYEENINKRYYYDKSIIFIFEIKPDSWIVNLPFFYIRDYFFNSFVDNYDTLYIKYFNKLPKKYIRHYIIKKFLE